MSVWKNEPFVVQVKAGERKAICNCRHSSTPPFCDGSHKEMEYEPTVISFDQNQAVYFVDVINPVTARFVMAHMRNYEHVEQP